jgi:hypothetical protein
MRPPEVDNGGRKPRKAPTKRASRTAR